MVTYIVEASALGLGIGLLLWLIRKQSSSSGVRVWVLLAGLAGAVYLGMRIMSVPPHDLAYKISLAATIILGANAVLQLLNLLLYEHLLRKRGDVVIPRLIVDIINFIILAVVFFAVLNWVFGVKLSGILLTSTVISAIIGFSLQDILGNLFAGLALQMERPYVLDDWIRVGEQEEGRIVQMNWRSLTIATRTGDHVTLPNATVAKERVANFSRPSTAHMCRTTVGMAYSHLPGTVKSVIVAAAQEVDGVLKDPPPEVLLSGFAAYSVEYDVRFWIANYRARLHIEDAVRTRIWYALQRAGMSIPFPISDVTVRSVPEDQETRVRDRLRSEVIGELGGVDIFSPLTDQQIAVLADTTTKLLFTRGELLVSQGSSGDSLFVITGGRVEVYVQSGTGRRIHLAELGEGDYFGEMSLLTGEPRSASVEALTDTEVIMVEKRGLADILESEPEVLEPLTDSLEKRLEDLSGRLAEGAAVEPSPRERRERKEHLFTRICDFFGLSGL